MQVRIDVINVTNVGHFDHHVIEQVHMSISGGHAMRRACKRAINFANP